MSGLFYFCNRLQHTLDLIWKLVHKPPMGLLAALWNLYLGLLTVLGHGLLIIAGIALCGYATMQQLEPLHDTQTDVIIFGGGLLLISFSMIRRIIWTFAGLGAVWGAAVWFGARELGEHDESFSISTELIALAVVPPLLVTLFLEATRKRAVDNGPELEISLSTKNESGKS